MTKEFKTTDLNIELVKKIVSLGMEIQAKTKYCVFFDLAGHVNQFEMKIVSSKDNYERPVSTRLSLYLTPYSKEGDDSYEEDTQKITAQLERAVTKLEMFLGKVKPTEPFLDFDKE